jgi:TolB-like protein
MVSLEGGESVTVSARSGRALGWSHSMDELANQLAQRLRWNGRDRMKVAVLDFVEAHGRECTLGAPAAEDLTTSLFSTNKFEIIERRMLDSVLKENQATQSDLYDPGHVARLGGLMGADAFVTGTVVASQHEFAFNSRVILAESGGVASAARVTMPLSEADGRGTCGDGRQIIAAPPFQ